MYGHHITAVKMLTGEGSSGMILSVYCCSLIAYSQGKVFLCPPGRSKIYSKLRWSFHFSGCPLCWMYFFRRRIPFQRLQSSLLNYDSGMATMVVVPRFQYLKLLTQQICKHKDIWSYLAMPIYITSGWMENNWANFSICATKHGKSKSHTVAIIFQQSAVKVPI